MSYVIDDQEEVYSLAKAKGCHENEIYEMKLKDYYPMIGVLEKHMKRKEK